MKGLTKLGIIIMFVALSVGILFFFIRPNGEVKAYDSSYQNSTGWVSPTLGTSATWVNPTNIYASDNSDARSDTADGELLAKNFDLTNDVPYGYIIENVTIRIETAETEGWSELFAPSCNGDVGPFGKGAYTSISGSDHTLDVDWTIDGCRQAGPTTLNRWTRNRLSNANFTILIRSKTEAGCYPNKTYVVGTDGENWTIDRVDEVEVGDTILVWNEEQGLYYNNVTRINTHEGNWTLYDIYSGELMLENVQLKTKFKSHIELSGEHPVQTAYSGKMNASELYDRWKEGEEFYISHLWYGTTLNPFPITDITVRNYTGTVYDILTDNPDDKKMMKKLTDEEIGLLERLKFSFKKQVELGPPFLLIAGKSTSYVDWIAVNVTYGLDTWVIDSDVSAALTLTNEEDANSRAISTSVSVANAGDKWYQDYWDFIIGNTTDSGTIDNVTAKIYNIKAVNTSVLGDTWEIQCSNDDGRGTWNTLEAIAGADVWGSYTNKLYDIYTNCGVDTWGEVNETRIRITSTAKSGSEDSMYWYVDAIYVNVTVADTTKPYFTNNATNTTIAGNPVNFSVEVNDETALSYCIPSTNNTGQWQNASTMSLSGTKDTCYNTTILNSTTGALVQYRFFANDTSNNWNSSEIYNLTTTSADTCTPTAGQDWNVDCCDNCVNTVARDLGGYAFTIVSSSACGQGTFYTTADIINYNYFKKEGFDDGSNRCRITCVGGCFYGIE